MMRAVSIACVLAIAAPVLAQDATRDWDVHRDASQRLVMAYTVFDNGLGISVRCRRNSYEAVVHGLPAAPGRDSTRTIGVSFGDETLWMRRWNVAIDRTVALNELPAHFARKLRLGGRLQMVVPDGAGEGRNLRYDLTLPASSTAIDETLTSCERPLVDPRDAELAALSEEGLPADLTWSRRPNVQFPDNRYARGFALITCLTSPNGAMRECSVESEHPADGGFGDAALRGARRAAARRSDGSREPVPVRMVQFRVNFLRPGY